MASARSVRQDFSVRIMVVVALAACGGASKPVAPTSPTSPISPSTPNPELTPALEPVAWMLGDWHGDNGATAHGVAAGGTIYLVFLNGDASEVKWGASIL